MFSTRSSTLPLPDSVGSSVGASGGSVRPHGPDRVSDRSMGARSAPLDLIKGHLTDGYPVSEAGLGFRPGMCSGFLVENWHFPEEGRQPWQGEMVEAAVLKVQSFKAGGFEASVRVLNLEKISRAIEFPRRKGKREAPEVACQQSIEHAASRARRKVRHLVKNMGASHLATFTRRETVEAEFWTPEQWAKAWDRLRRGVERILGPFPYVAILERHKKGNFHLHVAWVGRINLNVIRPLWWAICGGRGAGNVDAQYIKVRQGLERSDRVAKYISKYVAKMFEEAGRFNKKRYWASRQDMADVRRYVLRAGSMDGVIEEVRRMFCLDWGDFTVARRGKLVPEHVFLFPDGSGLWLNFLPDLHGGAPPPF